MDIPADPLPPNDPSFAPKSVRPRTAPVPDIVTAMAAQLGTAAPPAAAQDPAPGAPSKPPAEKPPPPDGLTAAVAAQLEEVDNVAKDWNNKPVTITDEDREQFKIALATMGRFRRRVKLYDGALTLTFRTRTFAETNAILNWHRLLIEQQIVPPEAYQSYLWAALVGAQLEAMNGEQFPELEQPLLARPTGRVNAETKRPLFTPPGWHIRTATRWVDTAGPGLVSEIVHHMNEFERTYYALLREARTTNFPPTAASS